MARTNNDEIADCITISPHIYRITDLCISKNNQYLYSTSHDSLLKSLKVCHLAFSSICCMNNKL